MVSFNRDMVRRILRRTKIGPGCWLWQGARNKKGYGNMTYQKRCTRPHRLMLIAFVGELPPKIKACHECDVTNCVRPSHLFPGTAKQNALDAKTKGRLSSGARHSTALKRWWAAASPEEQAARAQQIKTLGEQSAKLTTDDAEAIKVRLAAGELQQAIADDLGVSNQTISAINRGAPRKYIGG